MNTYKNNNTQRTATHLTSRSTGKLFQRTMVLAACLLIVAGFTGCASTKVTSTQVVTEKLPRPGKILVYDFAASPADIPADSPLARTGAALPPEQVALGRKLGTDMATQLAEAIQGMGLPATRAGSGAGVTPQVNDLVVRGYLVSMDEGSATKRFAIGFGSGASELVTVVEGFQMTPQGLRMIGTGSTDAGGSKGPGTAVGVAGFAATGNPAGLIVSSGMKIYGEASGKSKVEGRAKQSVKEIAGRMKKRFQEQGWIN